MANKRYDQFPAGVYDTAKIFLQADAATGTLEKINLPTIPVVTPYTGTANRITVSSFAIDIAATYVGQTSITTLGTIGTGLWNGTKISEAFGGTNQSTYATGDILYASAANTLSKLAIGGTGNILSVVAGIPTWSVPTTLLGYLKQDGSLPLTAGWETNGFITTSTFTGQTANTYFDGRILSNTTAATAANQQFSPGVRFIGQGWKTNATAASQTCDMRLYMTPTQQAANPIPTLKLDWSTNGGGYTTIAQFNSGVFTFGPGITSSGAINGTSYTTNAGQFTMNGGNIGTTSADGMIITNDNPATAGVPIQYSRRLRLSGLGYSGAASQRADWTFESRPINGTNPITSTLAISSSINGGAYNARVSIFDNGRVTLSNVICLKGYTVAALPAGNVGDTAYVTDALAPAFGANVVGGGAVTIPVFFNNANWIVI